MRTTIDNDKATRHTSFESLAWNLHLSPKPAASEMACALFLCTGESVIPVILVPYLLLICRDDPPTPQPVVRSVAASFGQVLDNYRIFVSSSMQGDRELGYSELAFGLRLFTHHGSTRTKFSKEGHLQLEIQCKHDDFKFRLKRRFIKNS